LIVTQAIWDRIRMRSTLDRPMSNAALAPMALPQWPGVMERLTALILMRKTTDDAFALDDPEPMATLKGAS
jgi:hypothetical protein